MTTTIKKLTVLPIKPFETHAWLLKKHYAKRLCPISYAFGLYENENLVGVVTYGMPASNSLCVGVCGEEYKSNVLELNRLCCNSEKNYASFLISKSLKMLPKNTVVVSYADSAQGHIGYVYQATNWIYTGATKERTDMFAGDGKHSRHGKSNGLRQFRSSKHRYVYFVGSKTQKIKMLNKLNYEIKDYPKGETKRYDASANVETQKLLFA